ncbi:MAG: O-antigen ligase family protein, partial [Flavobacteriales bacterium]|nr:O-antigen ligase family protein [Flavobacteriales bacterium]
FQRFFSGSVFVGFMALLLFIGVFEYAYSNLEAIVSFFGAEEYLRVNTLESGSGRYFAWEFAWVQLQSYIVFGGGFGTDEYVMRSFYEYLERMGHQGGVHNSYISLWFDVGIVGLVIYLRSLFLIFIKASRFAPMSMAVLFSVLFSVTYESWLVGSLNPFTILFVISMTMLSEEEIVLADPEFQGSDNMLTLDVESAERHALPGHNPSTL